MDQIINKVADSVLEVFDLEDYYPHGARVQIDISFWLIDGFILIEKDFREKLKNHDWTQYQDCYVAIHCGTEAIIPAWASILVSVYVQPFAKMNILGTLSDLETAIFSEVLSKLDYQKYKDKPMILKGCSKKPVPETAYLMAINRLLPFAKSISFGEACSSVPLYKKQKNNKFIV
jgi:Protein of unknown function (DUF2480)